MHIKKKLNQYRRDFQAVYQCEHCDHEVESYGYDDAYFHQDVVSAMECPECGKTADTMTPTTTPDVPAHVVI